VTFYYVATVSSHYFSTIIKAAKTILENRLDFYILVELRY